MIELLVQYFYDLVLNATSRMIPLQSDEKTWTNSLKECQRNFEQFVNEQSNFQPFKS